jgi:putative nucleotidyltransferase with HDIG domain
MTAHDAPLVPFPAESRGRIPADEECFASWRAFGMLDHIRSHSLLVADIATDIAGLASQAGVAVHVQAVRASGLLHDLGKTHTVRYGGNHSQIGATWVMELTRNPAVAQGVVHHVYWPGRVDVRLHTLPLAIIYADKRVKHDRIVSLRERRADILDRYGTTADRCRRIGRSFRQVEEIANEFGNLIGVDLHAHPFDRRRLVE